MVTGVTRSARWTTLALGAWSLLIWSGRLRNLAVNDDLTLGRGALAVSFVVGGLVVAIAALRRAAWLTPAVSALAAWTIVVWVIRGTAILLADHEGGFKVVHTVLALVSIGLAALAIRSVAGPAPDRRRVPASGSGSRPRP